MTTVLALLVVALVGAGAPPKGLSFRRDGHWVFVESLRAAFHVDGGAARADARTGEFDKDVRGVAAGRQSVVGIGPGVLDVVRGADLVPEVRLDDAPDEMPVQLRADEFGLLVYRQAGVVRRLTSLRPDSITIGTPIGEAVAQPDGTLWLTGRDDRRICWIEPDAALPHCQGALPNAQTRLVLVDGRPLAVDTRADAAHAVTERGLGRPVRLALDLPDDAKLAMASTGGEIVALAGRELLVAGVTKETAGRSGRIPVAANGPFQAPHVSGQTVVLVPAGTGPVVSLNRATGVSRESAKPIPSGTVASEPDGHVYVDGTNGTTVVVAATGEISAPIDLDTVRVPGPPKPKPKPKPTPKPDPKPPVPAAPVPVPESPRKPVRPLAPRNVDASPGDKSATVTWDAPGSDVSRYVVEAFQADAVVAGARPVEVRRTAAGTRTVTFGGLTNGTPYVFWVTAGNAAGSGPAARSPIVTPSAEVPTAPGDVRVTGTPGPANDAGRARVVASWSPASGEGREITGYAVTLTSDGSTLTRQVDGRARSLVFTAADGLQPGTRYAATVRARNDAGVLGPEAASPGTALFWRAADAPTGLVATAGDGQVELRWAMPALNGGSLVHYAIRRSDGSTAGESQAPDEIIVFGGLQNGTTYTFTVWARTDDGAGGSPLDGAVATIQATPGRAPEVVGLSASLTGDRTATVSFSVDDHDSGADQCQVLFDGAVRWNGACADAKGGVTVGGLAYSHTYTVTARATNGYGTGEGQTTVRTNDPPPPPRAEIAVGPYQGPCTIGSGECYFVAVRLYDFAPNSNVTIRCSDEDTPNWMTYTVRTDATGSFTGQRCSHAKNGQFVWVTANTVESPHIRFQ